MDGDVQSDLATMAFNNGKQLEYFHSRLIRLQQEIILSGETFSPTILLLHYTKEFSKRDKLKALIAPNMTDLITFLNNNRNSDIYKGGKIHTLYRYLEMIGSQEKLTTSGQRSHH